MTYEDVRKFHEDSKNLAMLYRIVINANPERKGLKKALELLATVV